MAAIKTLPSNAGRAGAAPDQEVINSAVYNSRGVYRYYLSKLLTQAEFICLFRNQPHILDRDVLDVGVGAGRTTRYLAPLARRYEAVDYSQVMTGYMQRTMPEISVRQADFKDLSVFADSSFDFVLATDNVIDALSHADRSRALGEAARVLRSGGILAFSCHNLGYKKAFSGPQLAWSSNPVRLAIRCAGYALSLWNHRRVGSQRTRMPDYALLNDPGHRYACLHYYAARPTVAAQLASAGLRIVEVFDIHGRILPENAVDSENPSLFYTAERV